MPNSTEKKDKTRIVEHYDSNGKLYKREYEFDDYSCVETNESNNYFTKDGFKYLTIKDGYTLIDRDSNFKIEFADMFEFHKYFITEILLKCENKPFLINENSERFRTSMMSLQSLPTRLQAYIQIPTKRNIITEVL